MKYPVAMPRRFDRIEAVRAAEHRQTWFAISMVGKIVALYQVCNAAFWIAMYLDENRIRPITAFASR